MLRVDVKFYTGIAANSPYMESMSFRATRNVDLSSDGRSISPLLGYTCTHACTHGSSTHVSSSASVFGTLCTHI